MDHSEATRIALVDSAVVLFTIHGYAGTSVEAVAARAQVTKGALYHHFRGKRGMFEAAFIAVEQDAAARLDKLVADDGSPWDRAIRRVVNYLHHCLDPSYQRIVIQEGPMVMGPQRCREAVDDHSFRQVKATIQTLIQTGEMVALPTEGTARILFGALAAGAAIIAGADDPNTAGAEVSTTILAILEGLRSGKHR
jgi:AcrR family transcriptional regulator